MADHFFLYSFPKLSIMALILILVLFLISRVQADLDQTNYVSADIASILPSSTCKSSANSQGLNGESTLGLVYGNGPCYNGRSNSNKQNLTVAQILRADESRVHYIQSRYASNNKTNDQTLHAQPSQPLEFIVTVGIGTPEVEYPLIFDTGSDITWFQCTPSSGPSYNLSIPLFNPLQSKSYSNLSCDSHECSLLQRNHPGKNCSGTCSYIVNYTDHSFTMGTLAKETITLGKDVFPDFVFGCGHNNQGTLGRTEGILGLSHGKFALAQQTVKTYKRVFSYCLPTFSGSDGYLRLGKEGIPKDMKYTPLPRLGNNNNYFFVNIIGITVGGKMLNISPSVFEIPKSVIDSGTTLTYLPPSAYLPLRDAFKAKMTKFNLTLPCYNMDTCYDFTGVNLNDISVPEIKFLFEGNVTVELGRNGLFMGVSAHQMCFAFVANKNPNDLVFFGNIQQQTQQVIYDVDARKLGFSPNGCS